MVYSKAMRAMLLFLVALPLGAQTWKPLFDGKTLTGWKEAEFKNHGKIGVDNGTLVIGAGVPMTGATFTGDFPKTDYEIRYEAERLRGGDFFASLTFPVGDSFCTWIAGGWGGDIVGLSSIDNWDASENETRAYFNFERAHWYRFHLQVTAERIQAWIDDQRVINVNIAGRSIGLRFGEMKLSAPLGLVSYNTEGSVRNIEYRLLK